MPDSSRTRGATVDMKMAKWSKVQKLDTLKQVSHKSSCQHMEFLCEEFVDMVNKGNWVLLPTHLVIDDEHLRLSPLGVMPQRDHRPRTIYDSSFFLVNLDKLPLAASESMQFGRALWHILQQISNADPRLGLVHLSKIDIADGFYRIWINADSVPKLRIVFPGSPGDDPLIVFALVLPMGWMHPPLFTAAMEMVADLANQQLHSNARSLPNKLDLLSEAHPQAANSINKTGARCEHLYHLHLCPQASLDQLSSLGMWIWMTSQGWFQANGTK
jgi:hypothetical protein